MTKGVRKFVVLLALTALLTGSVSACGDDGSDSTTTGSTAATGVAQDDSSTGAGNEAAAKTPGGGSEAEGSSGENGGGGGKSESSGEGSSSVGSSVAVVPLRVSGGGSDQFRSPGGDNSIQTFGSEGDEATLEAAAEALHSFLVARGGEDWDTACSYLSEAMVQQLEELASKSAQLKGCGPILDALTAPIPSSLAKEWTEIDAASLRQEGERAFLLYHGAKETAYFMPMVDEDGTWKVGALAPTPIL